MNELEFLKKWNSVSDEEKWNILLKEHKNKDLKVILDYDSVNVTNDGSDLYLEFDEISGSISGLYILLTKLGISVEYVE